MNKQKHAKNTGVKASLRQNKQLRRRWITFLRMCRYGVNNFSRNAWLTAAATAVMTVTLLIVFSTLVARNVLTDTVDDLKEKVDVSIYLKDDVTQKEAEGLENKLKDNDNVTTVNFISADEARTLYVDQNDVSEAQLETIAELPNNPFPAALRVAVKDLNDMGDIQTLVNKDEDFQAAISPDPARKPSFAGERRTAIQNIGRTVNFAERVGLAASALFIVISILIIFNTIRMAIFNRKEEIEMMRLIGADKNFIRGPFTVEAMMYGFIAALLAFGLGIAALYAVKQKLVEYGIAVQPTIDFIVAHSPFVLIALILLGCIIGVISSTFAVRRYLKV